MILFFFRIIAFLEGVSYLLLLTLGLYYKYYLFNDTYVKLLGMPHGVLFILYVLMVFLLKRNQRWGNIELCIILLASIIPFGTFYVERKYLKKRISYYRFNYNINWDL